MKCDRCFFCTHIGRGIYAEYPVKYCKYHKKYLLPFVETQDNGGTVRPLDFNNKKDLKMWSETGCNTHPSRVEKVKNEVLQRLENELLRGEENETD
jgi:hypothetical protein